MTIRAGEFSTTTKVAVTGTADDFTVDGAPESNHAYLVCSDVIIHITRNPGSATVATADNGMRIPDNNMVLIHCKAGDVISYIVGDGESDGSIWFTKVDR